MSIPDAPWVGKCREDYYGYDDEECMIRCEGCGEEIDESDAVEVYGDHYCRHCFYDLFSEEEREELENEKLHG